MGALITSNGFSPDVLFLFLVYMRRHEANWWGKVSLDVESAAWHEVEPGLLMPPQPDVL